MTSWKQDEIVRSLTKKGFKEYGGDHKNFALWVDGKRTGVQTRVSRGKKFEISFNTPVFTTMKRQLNLNKSELDRLLSCPMNKDELVRVLREKKVIE
jgi:hypothetical protein